MKNRCKDNKNNKKNKYKLSPSCQQSSTLTGAFEEIVNQPFSG